MPPSLPIHTVLGDPGSYRATCWSTCIEPSTVPNVAPPSTERPSPTQPTITFSVSSGSAAQMTLSQLWPLGRPIGLVDAQVAPSSSERITSVKPGPPGSPMAQYRVLPLSPIFALPH